MKKCALDEETLRFMDAREKIKSAIDRILKGYSSRPLTRKKEQEFAVHLQALEEMLKAYNWIYLRDGYHKQFYLKGKYSDVEHIDIDYYIKSAAYEQNYQLLKLLLSNIPIYNITDNTLDYSLNSFFNSLWWKNGVMMPHRELWEKSSKDPEIMAKFKIVELLILWGAKCNQRDLGILVSYKQVDLIEMILNTKHMRAAKNSMNALSKDAIDNGLDTVLANMALPYIRYEIKSRNIPPEKFEVTSENFEKTSIFKMLKMFIDLGGHCRADTFKWFIKNWLIQNDEMKLINMILDRPNNGISQQLLNDILYELWGYETEKELSRAIYGPDSDDPVVRQKFKIAKTLTDHGALCRLSDFELFAVHKQIHLIKLVNINATPQIIDNWVTASLRIDSMNTLPLVAALIQNKNQEIVDSTIHSVLKNGQFHLPRLALMDINDISITTKAAKIISSKLKTIPPELAFTQEISVINTSPDTPEIKKISNEYLTCDKVTQFKYITDISGYIAGSRASSLQASGQQNGQDGSYEIVISGYSRSDICFNDFNVF